MAFDGLPVAASDVELRHGRDGRICGLRHRIPYRQQIPYRTPIRPEADPEGTLRQLAAAYLDWIGPLYGLSPADLHGLDSTPRNGTNTRGGPGYRWGEIRSVRRHESSLVVAQQTYVFDGFAGPPLQLDVWESGLRIYIHADATRRSRRVTGSDSTALAELRPLPLDSAASSPAVRATLAGGDAAGAVVLTSMALGVPPDRIAVHQFDWCVYRVAPGDRRDLARAPRAKCGEVFAGCDALPPLLPPSSPAGTDLVVLRVDILLKGAAAAAASAYRLLIDPRIPEIVYLEPLAACATGQVFALDPASATGDPTRTPGLPTATLDTHAVEVELQRLNEPVNGRQSLTGRYVALDLKNELGIAPPQRTWPPFDFGATARSNDFAAVSAYHHCDAMFQMIADFGFPMDEYFEPGQFPVRVAHRAVVGAFGCTDGLCVNAQVLQEPGSRRIAQIKFALADLSNTRSPLGVACDPRWVWHEFGHVLLIAATGSPEFKFAHSIGDSLAAILADPESRFACDTTAGGANTMRGMTFPWVSVPSRRHDRNVTDGWGWRGTYHNPPENPRLRDPDGYYAEQILSSSLFRLYRAIGGDATTDLGEPDIAVRRRAARHVVHLIVRGLRLLGPSQSVAARTVDDLAHALIQADIGTLDYMADGCRHLGGRIHKVVRWAFERQGLYHPPSAPAPLDEPGPAESIDIYIDDGRSGEYGFTGDWHARPDAMWIRHAPDGKESDQPPKTGVDNFVYVRVGNRGTRRATNVTVSAFAAADSAIGTWPGWQPLLPVVTTPPVVGQIDPGESTVLGPFTWRPMKAKRNAVLIFAGAPGDPANVEASANLACAEGPTPVEELVPFDNNIAMREW